ncbi:MAG: hypothetical protein WA777_11185 [Rhodanobacter sp.]
MAKKISDLAAATALDGTELLEAVQGGVNVKALLGALVPPGYLDGLQLQWVNGTALTVTSGAAYISSLGRVLRVPNAITKNGIVLTASAWYHVYLLFNGASVDIEVVTTAPAAPYNGVARAKTGDASRRYLGSVRTNASAQITKFYHDPIHDRVMYLTDINDPNLMVLSNGQAASAFTSVSMATGMPPTARLASIFCENSDTANYVSVNNSESTVPTADILFYVRPVKQPLVAEVITSSNQAIQYRYQGAPSGGFTIWITGYTYER